MQAGSSSGQGGQGGDDPEDTRKKLDKISIGWIRKKIPKKKKTCDKKGSLQVRGILDGIEEQGNTVEPELRRQILNSALVLEMRELVGNFGPNFHRIAKVISVGLQALVKAYIDLLLALKGPEPWTTYEDKTLSHGVRIFYGRARSCDWNGIAMIVMTRTKGACIRRYEFKTREIWKPIPEV